MKKGLLIILLILFISTACSNTSNIEKGSVIKDKTIETLLNQYIEGYLNADSKRILDVIPDFVTITNPYQYSQFALKESLSDDKEKYGYDLDITYEINEKTLLDNVQLEKLNELISNAFKTNDKVSECYSIYGSMTYYGSKGSSEDDLSAYYCKYNDKWYLLMN